MKEQIKLPAQEWLGYDPERGDLHGYTFEQMREFADFLLGDFIQKLKQECPDRPYIINNIKRHYGLVKN
jgi:methionine synthase II (cobalamin-independent)